MTKQRIYGENVLVKLTSSKGKIPYIMDFDSIEISYLGGGFNHRGIGRTITTYQATGGGYEITLTRAKRDNFVDSLMNFHEYCLSLGLEAPTFDVDYIAFHGYSDDDVDLRAYYEIKDPFTDLIKAVVQNPLITAGGDFLFNKASNFIGKAVNNVINSNEALKSIQNNVNKAVGVASAVQGFAKAILDQLPLPVQRLQDTSEYITLMNKYKYLKERNNFKEQYIYEDCTIQGFTSGDKPREVNSQVIKLFSSTRINLTESNKFDKHLEEGTLQQFADYSKKIIQKVNQNTNTKNDKIGDYIKKSLENSFNEKLQEIKGVGQEYQNTIEKFRSII